MKGYLSLGTNIGDLKANLEIALNFLKKDKKIKIKAISSYYLTEPIDIQTDDWFWNLVTHIETSYSAFQLLNRIQRIEKNMGRINKGDYSSRIIDIDIIAYEKFIINSDNLVLPHQKMKERLFVLIPLRELYPDWSHPITGEDLDTLIHNVGNTYKCFKLKKSEV
ncbi:2-amino-4-hydroxy-6-hydroxymethyldihydropteridine diphosphokinase [bacterium]